MSRVTKYRAWDKEDSRMIVHEQEFIPLKICSLGVLRLDPHYANNLWEIMPIDRFHIMQFTGLLDKNGKEIYEGDIVKCASSFGCPHEVIWAQVPNDNLGAYHCWYLQGLGPGYTFTGKEEIIGNIYENPDLLTRLASDAATI